jgi:hypothetical protein
MQLKIGIPQFSPILFHRIALPSDSRIPGLHLVRLKNNIHFSPFHPTPFHNTLPGNQNPRCFVFFIFSDSSGGLNFRVSD